MLFEQPSVNKLSLTAAWLLKTKNYKLTTKKMRELGKQFLFAAVCFLSAFTTVVAQNADWTTIRNGIEWTDTEGYIVQAHGGNFLQHGSHAIGLI